MILKKTGMTPLSNETQLHCPLCEFEYTHLIHVETSSGLEGRLNTTLTFVCESGHEFKHDFSNHEGHTIVRTEFEK